ncbi:S-layer homology domain-containing protein [Aeromicrobium sp. Sec7.5]|uniref:S-layer homology domain-containing protein n=1 Tax=Aeromicrobium sp. Sec7.5 TaxID=3121276 RepID=UPI002FE4A049
MSVRSTHRRLAAGLIAGLALTLAPAVAMTSASAAPVGDAPAPPVDLRVDTSMPAVRGEVNVIWNPSADADISEYAVNIYYDDGSSDLFNYQGASDRTYTVTGLDDGQPFDIEVRSLRTEQFSDPAQLRVTSLDAGPVYQFNDLASTVFQYEIAWLSSAGITTGYINPDWSRSFAPSAPVLREQMAAFLYRYAGSPPVDLPPSSPFTDVSPSATFYKEIVWLAQQEITTGYAGPNGTATFRPSAPVLREQMAAFLFRASGTDFSPEAQSFSDVPPTATFYFEIEWLAAAGISTGYLEANGDTTFRPSQAVLREQMAAFIYRLETGPFGKSIGSA